MNLPSGHFVPQRYGLGAWTANIHFAYDVVAALRPRLLVELGTERGESYFSFCQSALENTTDTRCFATDTWRGDHQTGAYDETIFTEVSLHNRAHFSGFSTLLRMNFDDALEQFARASIDVLHIDGLHTEAAVRHDFEAWLPKVAPGGLILLHDVAVRTHDFGVWKLWEELDQPGRAFTFPAGPGLGLWQKPPASALPPPLEQLLRGPASAQEGLVQYYRERAQSVQARIEREWADGTIRETAIAQQTAIQVFHTHDGTHSEENSVGARLGHEAWKDVSIPLPVGAGAAPLRLDFISALTVIDLRLIRLASETETLFAAEDASGFEQIKVAGDAKRLPHDFYLRVQVTGVDPQLYFPVLLGPRVGEQLTLTLRLRVNAHAPED